MVVEETVLFIEVLHCIFLCSFNRLVITEVLISLDREYTKTINRYCVQWRGSRCQVLYFQSELIILIILHDSFFLNYEWKSAE